MIVGPIASDLLTDSARFATRHIGPSDADVDKMLAALGFGSLDDALASGIFEAVDLMVPHHLHEQLATTSFAAGKHVLLEKPIATNGSPRSLASLAWSPASTPKPPE